MVVGGYCNESFVLGAWGEGPICGSRVVPDDLGAHFGLFLHFTSGCSSGGVIFPRCVGDLLNCNFVVNDGFRVLHGPWGLERGRATILGSRVVRDDLRRLAAVEAPARGLGILSNFRMLVPWVGEERSVAMSGNVNSPFKKIN